MKDSIWKLNPSRYLKECQRLIDLCHSVISGQTSIIEGARSILAYREDMGEGDNKGWNIFVVVESDSDHLPVGEIRQHWAEDALRAKDIEIKNFESFYRKPMIEACYAISTEYKNVVEQVAAPDA